MNRKVVNLALAAVAAVMLTGGPALAGDAAKGKKVYNKCKACHSLDAGKNKIGPSLHGVIGRKAGAVDGFKYSSALMDSGIVWTEDQLSAYLEKPKEFIPGNKMAFAGLKKEDQRADVIAYIKENAM